MILYMYNVAHWVRGGGRLGVRWGLLSKTLRRFESSPDDSGFECNFLVVPITWLLGLKCAHLDVASCKLSYHQPSGATLSSHNATEVYGMERHTQCFCCISHLHRCQEEKNGEMGWYDELVVNSGFCWCHCCKYLSYPFPPVLRPT